MKSVSTAAKWLLLISGALIVILGTTMLFHRYPWDNLITLAIFIGISMLIAGISEISSFFNSGKEDRSGLLLACGILSILFGAWTVFGPGDLKVAAVLPIIFAVWVMTSGIMRIIASVSSRSHGSKMWIGIVVLGVLEGVFGFVLLFHPMLTALILSFTLAFMLIFYGMNNIMLFFHLNRNKTLKPEV